MRRGRFLIVTTAMALALAACAAPAPGGGEVAPSLSTGEGGESTADEGTAATPAQEAEPPVEGSGPDDDMESDTDEGRAPTGRPSPPESVPPQEGKPVTGEVPSGVLEAIVTDALSRTGAASGDVTIVRAEDVVWNDGSLGCPEAGMFYTQALVAGYWVVLEVAGQQLDYRATSAGTFKLCAGVAPPSAPTG